MGERGPDQGAELASKAEARERRAQEETAKLLELGITRQGQRIRIPLLTATQSGDVEKIIEVFSALPGMSVVGATECELTNSPDDESGLNVGEALEEFCFRQAEKAYKRLFKPEGSPIHNRPEELGNAWRSESDYYTMLTALNAWARTLEQPEMVNAISDIETVDGVYNSSVVAVFARNCLRLTPEGNAGKFCSPLREEERQTARAELLELLVPTE